MEENQTKVTPIIEGSEPAKLTQKQERDRAKLAAHANEYYGFFRLGGALQFSVFRSMSDLEKAACALARTKIREEDAKFSMKCMMAVFDGAIERMLQGKPLPPDPEPIKVSPEEAAVSRVLDAVMPMNQELAQ